MHHDSSSVFLFTPSCTMVLSSHGWAICVSVKKGILTHSYFVPTAVLVVLIMSEDKLHAFPWRG